MTEFSSVDLICVALSAVPGMNLERHVCAVQHKGIVVYQFAEMVLVRKALQEKGKFHCNF